MLSDQIIEIGVDESERLYVMPQAKKFPYIYREAMEVQWDSARSVLHSPRPKEWSYLRWFQQILCAAREQGVRLDITHRPSGQMFQRLFRARLKPLLSYDVEAGAKLQNYAPTKFPEIKP